MNPDPHIPPPPPPPPRLPLSAYPPPQPRHIPPPPPPAAFHQGITVSDGVRGGLGFAIAMAVIFLMVCGTLLFGCAALVHFSGS